MDGRAFNWRLWVGAPLAGAAVVAAAFAMPVRLPETVTSTDPSAALPEGAVESAAEDLSAFLSTRRWGDLPEEAREPEPGPVEEAAPALNPVLAEMGFVGLIAALDERSVLLAMPEGDIVRMLPGDTLPDGRILVSVTDNSLTLQGEGQPAEVLTLFPRLPAEAVTPFPPTDPQGNAQGSEEIAVSGTQEAAASQ